MKFIVSILFGVVCVSAVSLVAGCGDSGDEGGTGGSAGASTGGGSGGSKASGGASSGGASSGGANSGGTGGVLGPHPVCEDAQTLADEHQAELNCENGAGLVLIACETVLILSPDCVDEFEALQACNENEPITGFECDLVEGTVSPVEGTCAEEIMVADDCATM